MCLLLDRDDFDWFWFDLPLISTWWIASCKCVCPRPVFDHSHRHWFDLPFIFIAQSSNLLWFDFCIIMVDCFVSCFAVALLPQCWTCVLPAGSAIFYCPASRHAVTSTYRVKSVHAAVRGIALVLERCECFLGVSKTCALSTMSSILHVCPYYPSMCVSSLLPYFRSLLCFILR